MEYCYTDCVIYRVFPKWNMSCRGLKYILSCFLGYFEEILCQVATDELQMRVVHVFSISASNVCNQRIPWKRIEKLLDTCPLLVSSLTKMRCNVIVYFARGGHFYWNTGVNTAKECIGIKFVKRSEREAKEKRKRSEREAKARGRSFSELILFFYKSGNPKSKKIGGQTFEFSRDLDFDFGFNKIKICFLEMICIYPTVLITIFKYNIYFVFINYTYSMKIIMRVYVWSFMWS
jgi:hypothetical protein